MSLSTHKIPTAGKITILTALAGVGIFVIAFMLNIGTHDVSDATAQSFQAETSIVILNIPPDWDVDAEEETESSTSSPTNSGDEVAWVATGSDSNLAPYFLLICGGSATPTANAAGTSSELGTSPPTCAPGVEQWAVSTGTVSGEQARAATTTTESMPEINEWYAWICDDDKVNPRCNDTVKRGTGSTASPFIVNYRPDFTVFSNDSPAEPGQVVTFFSTSSDPSTFDGTDNVSLYVCSTASFNVSTLTCDATTLASSTAPAASNPSVTYTIPIPTRDQNYGAFGYVVDSYGHAADGGAQGTDSVLEVANATPFVQEDSIVLNDNTDIVLDTPEGESTDYTMSFLASDNNSCVNAASGDEIVDWGVSVFRSSLGTSSCSVAGDYNPNNCYTSEVSTADWNVTCTASSTTCTGPGDRDILYECTYPLWYVADPTDGGATNTVHFASDWSAAARVTDDNGATSTLTAGTDTRELASFMYFALDTLAIPYGALEPGQRTDPLAASTTIRATGNVGLDQRFTGESMCPGYTSTSTCPNSSTSTIAESFQVFSTTTDSYADAVSSGYVLSSTTQVFLALNVPKSTATTTQEEGRTYWGIEVPSSITLAGSYTGENTFFAVVSNPSNW